MPDQSEFEHAFIASAPDFRGTFRCAIAPPMRSLCSCKTALALGGAADDAVAANQCEYGPISVKVLVYTETAPSQGPRSRRVSPSQAASMYALPRKSIATMPKLANRTPFTFVVNSFLVRAANDAVGHGH